MPSCVTVPAADHLIDCELSFFTVTTNTVPTNVTQLGNVDHPMPLTPAPAAVLSVYRIEMPVDALPHYVVQNPDLLHADFAARVAVIAWGRTPKDMATPAAGAWEYTVECMGRFLMQVRSDGGDVNRAEMVFAREVIITN